MKTPKYLRDMDRPTVLGYELDRTTLLPVRLAMPKYAGKDSGADPVGDGTFKMYPSGDIVNYEERNRRLTEI